MDDLKVPYMKRMDKAIFEQIDRFKTTPNYNLLTDVYNNLEEEQQKLAKGAVILVLFLIPTLVLSILWWQNQSVRGDLELRTAIMNKTQEIIGQSRGVMAISPEIISQSPIDSEGMLMSRVSNAIAGGGIDTNKISRGEFTTTNISEKIFQTEAVLNFTNLSTDELMNLFTSLIRREKMRISEVTITRNADSALLVGNFRVIHLSAIQTTEGE
ncbi:MAG: hypothetical protein V4598_08800 [Bdellovibrionota bacterium]